MKRKIKKIISKRPQLKRRRNKSPQGVTEAIQGIPRITNETVAEHREEVLSSARKYIYPLQHSAHRVVVVSIGLFIAVVVLFFAYCMLALYKFQSTSTFVYGITQVIPFPVGRAGSQFVSYESYLFELRHYTHYYETQQKVDFNSSSGKAQLAEFRKRALDTVINDAYVKQLAKKHDISVSDKELNDEITLVRSQNRLGGNDQVFEDVLKEFWGWSVNDFKRELKQQMLAQKVVATLDTAAKNRAQNVLNQLNDGAKFADLAKKYSDDANTRENGGDYGFAIDKSNRDVSPQVVDALFKLKPKQYSDIVSTTAGLEIVRVQSVEGDKVRASHILIAHKDPGSYIKPLREKNKPHTYIHP